MLTLFRPRIRTRHPSHKLLRPVHKNLPLFPFKSIIRLGSFTELRPDSARGRLEINTTEAIANSADKLKMKSCFTDEEVKTADWWVYSNASFTNATNGDDVSLQELPYPLISKHIRGSRGTGNKKHDTPEDFQNWINTKSNLNPYIFERYYNYTREYRLHVSEDGCFYTCRKMLKSDAPANVRWYRNDDHCVWIMEENELFDKPSNWDDVVQECVKALKAVGLDFGAIDLRIQSATDTHGERRSNPEFVVIEINSAPSFGDETLKAYLEELPKILNRKYNQI